MIVEEEELSIVELEENLGDVQKPPELPKAKYRGEVQEVQIATSAGKGNRYYAIRIVIPASEIPAEIAEHYPEGATLSWNRQLVPKAGDRRTAYRMKLLYQALGLDANTTSIDPNDWIGREVTCVVTMGKYQGEDRAEISALEAVQGAKPAAKPAPAAKAAAGRRR